MFMFQSRLCLFRWDVANKKHFGYRPFKNAAPKSWNTTPSSLKTAESSIFHRQLKIHFFCLSWASQLELWFYFFLSLSSSPCWIGALLSLFLPQTKFIPIKCSEHSILQVNRYMCSTNEYHHHHYTQHQENNDLWCYCTFTFCTYNNNHVAKHS